MKIRAARDSGGTNNYFGDLVSYPGTSLDIIDSFSCSIVLCYLYISKDYLFSFFIYQYDHIAKT